MARTVTDDANRYQHIAVVGPGDASLYPGASPRRASAASPGRTAVSTVTPESPVTPPNEERSVLPEARTGLRWLYLLTAVPFVTDLIETGRWPSVPREWLTEVTAGLVIALLVRKVRKQHAAVLGLARSDALTGMWNRLAYEEAVADECARARRTLQPLSLVYLDLDNFKQINDRKGHAAGDRVLQQLSAAIRAVVRARIDRGFRIGGDEFALLLPGSDAEQAQVVLNRIREHCSRSDPVWRAGSLRISAGVAEYRSHESTVDFATRADAAMYRMKQTSSADRAS